jgi:serine/threonine-protein kinase HipA
MVAKQQVRQAIQVCAHWQGMENPVVMGTLFSVLSRGKEVFSFEYDSAWLKSPNAQIRDPDLRLFTGPQYARDEHGNFGLFLDSCPDRWGRVLMQCREAQQAGSEERKARTLIESDYLLGVYDGHRMGALRFRRSEDEPFLDDQEEMAVPPWAKLRDLEYASLQLEQDNAENDKDYMAWLKCSLLQEVHLVVHVLKRASLTKTAIPILPNSQAVVMKSMLANGNTLCIN